MKKRHKGRALKGTSGLVGNNAFVRETQITLHWQDKAYRSTTMVIIEDIRSEMKDIRREMNELRESVNFMSSKYDNMKRSVEATDMKIKAVYVQMEGINNDINRNFDTLENKVEYLENQSRRNNIKIFGVPEEENEKTWDDTEVIVKTLIRNKPGIEVLAHRD